MRAAIVLEKFMNRELGIFFLVIRSLSPNQPPQSHFVTLKSLVFMRFIHRKPTCRFFKLISFMVSKNLWITDTLQITEIVKDLEVFQIDDHSSISLTN